MQFRTLLTLFCSLVHLPNVRSHPGAKHYDPQTLSRRVQNHEIETSITPYKSPPSAISSALSIRSKGSRNDTRIVYKDASFLIPSQQHAALLAKMYAQIYDALANAAAATEPVAQVVITCGGLVLTIVFFDERFIIRTIHDLLIDLFLVTMPIFYTGIIIWVGLPIFWISMRRQGLNEWHGW